MSIDATCSILCACILSATAGSLCGVVATTLAGEPLLSWLRRRLPTARVEVRDRR